MTLRNEAALEFLLTRRSRPAKTLTGPAPSKDELTVILEAGTRVPDHGKLEPWRLKVLTKPTLEKTAVAVKKYCGLLNCDETVTAKAVKQFVDGELGVIVIEVQKTSEKIPEIEKTYSAGAVCLSLVNAGLAAGWGANWLTGWLSHDKKFVSETFGLKTNERVAGIIYFGTETMTPSERPRPNLSEIVTWD
ncbi:nitroreductase family protein [Paracoccaceae bacterium]|nr:nitroreductase family protein [Paracoccaceae bacterium]